MGISCNNSSLVSCNNQTLSTKEANLKAMGGKPQIDHQSDLCKKALQKYFPGNMRGKEAEGLVAQLLLSRGFTDDNTLFTDSSCPDELNHNCPENDISSLFMERWGEVFPLGGLAGFPFTGKTGWGAFSSHCPVDGNICILFAPHVGVDNSGCVGKVLRDGQEHSSSACGAAIGAYAQAKRDKSCGDFGNGYQDHQMDCVKHLLMPHVDEISKAECEQAALVFKMYDILLQYLEDIINNNWMSSGSQLCIFGGIMINCDKEGTDRFLPLKFELRTKTSREDVFESVFGCKPVHSSKNSFIQRKESKQSGAS